MCGVGDISKLNAYFGRWVYQWPTEVGYLVNWSRLLGRLKLAMWSIGVGHYPATCFNPLFNHIRLPMSFHFEETELSFRFDRASFLGV